MIELFEIHKVNGTTTKIARFKPQYLLDKQELKQIKKRLEVKYNCNIMLFYREIPTVNFIDEVKKGNIKISKQKFSDLIKRSGIYKS